MKSLALLSLIIIFPLSMHAEPSDTLDVPGLFSVKAPLEGYRWKKDEESNEGWKFHCEKEGTAPVFSFTSDLPLVRIDVSKVVLAPKDRLRCLEEHYKFLSILTSGSKYEQLESKKPALEPVDLGYLTYTLQGKEKKSGNLKTVAALHLFGKYHYCFLYHAQSESENKSKEFFDAIIKTFTEKQAEGLDVLNVPGEFSIQAPEQGYKWKQVNEQTKDGVQALFFKCLREDGSGGVVLTVQKREAHIDAYRCAALKGSYNGAANAAQKSNFTILTSEKPGLESPIPDQVPWSFNFKSSSDALLFVQAATVFGKYIYDINVTADTEEKSKAWRDRVLKSLKEEPQDEKNRFVEAGAFSVDSPGNGFKWEKMPQQGYVAYACKKEGSEIRVILNCIDKQLTDNESKKKLLDHFIKFRKDQFTKDQITITEAHKPLNEWVYPEINSYSFKTKSPKGSLASLNCTALLLKNTYILEVTGPEKDNPKVIADALINSLRELKN
jgi:hypothetical protein